MSLKNVDKIELGERLIYLVGTAHVSRSSVELVENVIRDTKPDSVAVELCEARYLSLKSPDHWKNMDIVSVIRSGKAYLLVAQLLLAGFQKRLGDKLETKPGAEMLRAINLAEEANVSTVLADRNIKTTLKRTWASLGFWSMLKLAFTLLGSIFSRKEITAEEIERLKASDALDELMKDFSDTYPGIRSALIDERDRYLAAKIQSAPGKTIVAVVGAGHVPGIKNWIGKSIDLSPLEEDPPRRMGTRILAWSVPLLVMALIVYGFLESGAETSFDMMMAWFWINGFCAAFGAALALAHPLSIVSAFLAAPFTSIHPFLASGWVSGLVEAMVRKPRVSDFEALAHDMSTWKGIWLNRVSRVLLVMGLTNLFGSIGTVIGIKELFSWL